MKDKNGIQYKLMRCTSLLHYWSCYTYSCDVIQWTPEPPPKKKRKRVIRTAESMMSGFGSSSQIVSDSPSPDAEGNNSF